MLSKKYRNILIAFFLIITVFSIPPILSQPGTLYEKKFLIISVFLIEIAFMALAYLFLWLMEKTGGEVRVAGKRPTR